MGGREVETVREAGRGRVVSDSERGEEERRGGGDFFSQSGAAPPSDVL